MTGDNVIRGTRVGSGPVVDEADRGRSAPRKRIDYWCANGHHVRPSFAADAEAPGEWECPHCGLPAGQDQDDPPAARRHAPFKSHLAYVQERRSEAEGTAILDEALGKLRERRGG